MPTIQLRNALPVEINQQWKYELAQAVNSTKELLMLLGLENWLEKYPQSNPAFSLRVPRAYVAKMQPGDINDPLLRQVLPAPDENDKTGQPDPVGDLASMATPGLLHKYHGRVLLLTTGACAIHCRYCFRQHFPYSENCKQSMQWQQSLSYIQNDTSIHEVILSGGDPLTLDDQRLKRLCAELESIEHLKWLRIHTRLPVVLPARINASLLEWLSNSRFQITMVIHANHANELANAEYKALQELKLAGVNLLNQSVLLKGINDDAATLINLSHRLYDCGVLPYYLHLLDPVQGAMHFDVEPSAGRGLIESLRNKLPGYLVPQLVREDAGKASKTAIFTI